MKTNLIVKLSYSVGARKWWEGTRNAAGHFVTKGTRQTANPVVEKALLMICKIERTVIDGDRVVLRISGRLQAEHIGTLEELLDGERSDTVLDLIEVTLVDRDVVSFFAVSETRGIQLSNCPAFLREWITKEKGRIFLSKK